MSRIGSRAVAPWVANLLRQIATRCCLIALGLIFSSAIARAESWNYSFGTGTGSFTSSTASTNFLPAPDAGGGTARVRASSQANGGFVLQTSTIGTGSELLINVPTNTSPTKFSIYDYTASNFYALSFSTKITGTNGNFGFYIGDGAIFSDNTTVSFGQVATGLLFTTGTGDTLTLQFREGNSGRTGSTWTSTGLTTTGVTKDTALTFSLFGNNSGTAANYTLGETTYTLQTRTWDLWLGESRIGTNLATAQLAQGNVDSFMVIGLGATGANATFTIDDIAYANELPSPPPTPPVSALYWAGSSGWTGTAPGSGGTGTWQTGEGGWDSTQPAFFDGTAATVTIAGGGVTADNGISFLADGYTVSGGPLTIGATSNEIAVAAGASATISAPIAGNNGITKTSPGTLVLGGANTFSGGVTVAGGTLQIGVSEALGVRPVTINGGILAFDATPRTVSNAITFAGNGGLTGVLTLDGEVSFDNATRTVTVGEGSSVILSGSYGSGGIAKAGAGTLQLNASASLTALGITAGTMQIAEGVEVTTSSQPSVAGGTLAVNGTLRINSTSTSIAPVGVVSVGATGVVIQQGNGSLTNLLFSGTVPTWAPGSTLIFRDFTLTPSVSNRTYAMNLVYESSGTTMNVGAISGAGAWTVQGDLTIGENVNFDYGSYSGNLTYSGDVIVGGVLGATNGARSFTIGSGKQLRLENAGTLNIAAGQTATISGSVRTTATAGQNATIAGGSLSLGGGTRIVEVAAGTGSAGLTISSVVTDGSLTKTGAGVLRLTGSNTYAGKTDVTAGGLVIDGTVAGLVAVAEDAFIGGAGVIGGNLALASGAELLFEIGKTLTVNGASVTFGNFGISDLIGFSAAIPDGSYTLIDGLADIVTTNLRNFGLGNALDLGDGRKAYFSEGSLVLNVVPEPSAVVLAGLGGLLAAGYALRRRKSA